MTKENCNLKHCDILVEAIDFFSQSLHLDQLIYYGFELVNQALSFKASALYIIENDNYELKRNYMFKDPQTTIKKTTRLNSIATLYGRILTGDYDKYFDNEDVTPFQPDVIIPIIVKDELVGFIIAQYSPEKIYSESELALAFAINQLMNKAYENARSFQALEEKNYELDKKIFNLFFINHCSRTLLSELKIDHIYQLCIDIIRELTASAVTSFFMHDATNNRLVLKGYKNIIDFSQYYSELQLKSVEPKNLKIVYHVEKDRELLETIFENISEFEKLNAEYVILIVKERIVGLVTIAHSVSEREYDQTMLELIESIVTSIYISLTNALYFKAINEQKIVIQKKFETLTSLNRAIRNINQCMDPDELYDVTLNTLRWGFDVEKALIVGVSDNDYQVVASTEDSWKNAWVSIPSDTMKRINNQIFFHHDVTILKDLVPDLEEFVELGGNCLVIAPIVVDKLTLTGDHHIMGYIIVTEFKDMLQEEQVILVDSIANSIAPVLDHMIEKKMIVNEHKPNYEKLFMQDLEAEIQSKDAYEYDVYVYVKTKVELPFEKEGEWTIEGSYIFKGFEFCISDNEDLGDVFELRVRIENKEQFLTEFNEWNLSKNHIPPTRSE